MLSVKSDESVKSPQSGMFNRRKIRAIRGLKRIQSI
jgi:hypothetical protein